LADKGGLAWMMAQMVCDNRYTPAEVRRTEMIDPPTPPAASQTDRNFVTWLRSQRARPASAHTAVRTTDSPAA